jgi:hypothetical protein
MTPNNHIVFLCYGNESILRECALALLSLSKHYEPPQQCNFAICIYTDKPDWFSIFADCPFKLNFRQIDPATIRQWRGAIDFTHRVKIEALLDFTSTHDGQVLYCDTDVVFTEKPDGWFTEMAAGQLYMHITEGKVSAATNPILAKLQRHLSAHPLSAYPELLQATMWNAGVLGFSTAQKDLLNEALLFTDTLYPSFPKHIAEQFAFSVVMARRGRIMATAPGIIHYWNLKEVRLLLDDFFAYYKGTSWQQMVRFSRNINIPALLQQKANFYCNRSLLDKIRKKQWQPDLLPWQEMEQHI